MLKIDEQKYENFLRVIYPNYDAMKAIVLQEIEKGEIIVNMEGNILYNDEFISLPKYVDRKYLQTVRYKERDRYFALTGRIIRDLMIT